MTLRGDGNVGIGTTSPTYKLDITGGFADGTNNYIATFHSNTGTTGDAYIGIGAYRSDALGSGRNAYINAVAASGGSGALLLQTSGGNVGIGSTNPTRLLDVNGVIRTQNAGSAGAPSIELGTSAQGNGLFYPTTNTIAISTNDTERMRITSGGELLINTTSDAGDYKLQVNGNTRLGGLVDIASGTTSSFAFTIDVNSTFSFGSTNGKRTAIIRTTSSEDNGLQFGYDTNDNTGIIAGAGTLNGTGIDFYTYNGTSWGNRMRIKKDGNVEMYGSIKTAAPSGGTAKPWKLGEAGVTLGGSNTSGVRVEIDGTVYYLVTGYLP